LVWLYKKLTAIRKAHPALRSQNFYPEPYDEGSRTFDSQGYGINELKDVAIFHRWDTDHRGVLERFVVALNFSAFDQWVDIPFPDNGPWQDLLNEDSSQVHDYWLRNERISSHWGRVYFKPG
jgi:hypothetical protein